MSIVNEVLDWSLQVGVRFLFPDVKPPSRQRAAAAGVFNNLFGGVEWSCHDTPNDVPVTIMRCADAKCLPGDTLAGDGGGGGAQKKLSTLVAIQRKETQGGRLKAHSDANPAGCGSLFIIDHTAGNQHPNTRAEKSIVKVDKMAWSYDYSRSWRHLRLQYNIGAAIERVGFCERGLASHTVCCTPSCNWCGGVGCAGMCCVQDLLEAGRMCEDKHDVGCILPINNKRGATTFSEQRKQRARATVTQWPDELCRFKTAGPCRLPIMQEGNQHNKEREACTGFDQNKPNGPNWGTCPESYKQYVPLRKQPATLLGSLSVALHVHVEKDTTRLSSTWSLFVVNQLLKLINPQCLLDLRVVTEDPNHADIKVLESQLPKRALSPAGKLFIDPEHTSNPRAGFDALAKADVLIAGVSGFGRLAGVASSNVVIAPKNAKFALGFLPNAVLYPTIPAFSKVGNPSGPISEDVLMGELQAKFTTAEKRDWFLKSNLRQIAKVLKQLGRVSPTCIRDQFTKQIGQSEATGMGPSQEQRKRKFVHGGAAGMGPSQEERKHRRKIQAPVELAAPV
jgi:hypothetical protein